LLVEGERERTMLTRRATAVLRNKVDVAARKNGVKSERSTLTELEGLPTAAATIHRQVLGPSGESLAKDFSEVGTAVLAHPSVSAGGTLRQHE
jgi:hypothetical protein